jgi:hypothetical protein
MNNRESKLFEFRLQRAADKLRQLIELTEDADLRQQMRYILYDIQAGRYNAEERLKTAFKTWGGKYGFLPSGVIDYLEDDFKDRFSFDDANKQSDE